MLAEIQIPEAFAFLIQPKRYKVMYGGRGSGKSHSVARALLVMGMDKPMRIVCAREVQKSIKDSVHALLADLIKQHGLDYFYEVQESIIRGKNGTEFKFIGLKHNTRDIKSLEGTDICWVEEAENVSNNSWEILIPTIRKEGSEIWVSFNVKNTTDPTYQRFVVAHDDDIIAKKVSWRDNPFFPAILDKERRRLQAADGEAYLHVWEGMPDTRRNGAVYAKQIAKAREEGRITLVPYDPSYEVFTAWDLGFGDSTAIWWLQFVGRELRWLEYYENSGEQLDHYVKIIKDKPYNYSKHYLPHDAAAGNIRGQAVDTQLKDMGLINIVLKRTEKSAQIELLRQTMAYSVFDVKKCGDGLHALEAYHYEFDDMRGVFKKEPLHDWSSHCADAAAYAAQAASLIKNIIPAKPITIRPQYYSETSWMG